MGFPKREPVSSGGHVERISSAERRIETMAWIVGVASVPGRTLDMLLSRTASAMPKMKASMRVHVSLCRKSSWSCGLRMRRDGWMYVCCARFGGAGSEGVGGGGAEGGSRVVGARLRGMSLGSLALRSGGAAGCVCVMVL